ncbi:MAG: hypothetical protein HC831_17180 [Chloroflexia bacterium]|nr:hypothetical protein [Chloroflexia bacterium]
MDNIHGVGVFSNMYSPTTGVSFIGYGYNTYRWTVYQNGCNASDDVVVVYNVAKANAGSDQTSCNSHATLDANNPGLGSGMWTVESGTGTFSNPALYNTMVTNVGRGSNIYRWSVTAFGSEAYDEVVITNNSFDIRAGDDVQTCDISIELNAENPTPWSWDLVYCSGQRKFLK